MNKLSRAASFTLGFAIFALILRALFLPFSKSCYTDGILQIDCFRYGMTYWPPLYAVMTRFFSWIPGVGLEGGGRIVSLLAGALAILPLSALARRLFGLRAAIWTMAAWIASPMAFRWSLQVMTDMPMTALWTAALAGLVLATEQYLPGLFPPAEPPVMPDARRGNQWLLLATIAATLATLTRYQGIFLFPLTLITAWKLASMAKAIPNRSWNPWLTQIPWIIIPIWILRSGIAPLQNHFTQIGQRSGNEGFLATLIKIYWNNFEAFLLLSPYFVSLGLFGFLLFGLFRVNWATARLRWAGWVSLYLTFAILILSSIFSSFQERYLLPLIPLVCLFAGHGIASWERKMEKKMLGFWGLAGPALVYGIVFSIFVAMSQGSPFLDIKQAAQSIAEMKIPADQRIITNEIYNAQIGAVKVNFWSGDHMVFNINTTSLKPGDLIVLSNYCEGSDAAYFRRKEQLLNNQAIEQVGEPFRNSTLPLLPDLMVEPRIVYTKSMAMLGLNQNPVTWHYRYQEQIFETTVFRVNDKFKETLEAPIEVQPNPEREAQRVKQLEEMQNKLQQLNNATPNP